MNITQREEFMALCEVLGMDPNSDNLYSVMARAALRLRRLHAMEGLDWVVLTGETLPEGREQILVATLTGVVKEVSAALARDMWTSAQVDCELCFYSHWKKMPSHPQIPRQLVQIN